MLPVKGPSRWISCPSWDQMPTVWSKEPESILGRRSQDRVLVKQEVGEQTMWLVPEFPLQLPCAPDVSNYVLWWKKREESASFFSESKGLLYSSHTTLSNTFTSHFLPASSSTYTLLVPLPLCGKHNPFQVFLLYTCSQPSLCNTVH